MYLYKKYFLWQIYNLKESTKEINRKTQINLPTTNKVQRINQKPDPGLWNMEK